MKIQIFKEDQQMSLILLQKKTDSIFRPFVYVHVIIYFMI